MTHAHHTWLTTPLSIVIAGALIAVSIYMGAREIGSATPKVPVAAAVVKVNEKIRPLSSQDHVLGNPAAKVAIIEYSDTECPYCKKFHATLHQVMEAYKKSGTVAWAYRHLPLDMHSKAKKEAEATECAAEQGGNAKFWPYIDALYEITPSNNRLDPAELPKIAEKVGLDRAKFETCLSSGKYGAKVDAQAKEAEALGATGTPYTIIMSGDKAIPLKGAVSFERIDAAIKELLGQK